MEDFKNYMLAFLKQEKRQDSKQQEKWQENLKRLHESIEWQERFGKLLECLTKKKKKKKKKKDPGNYIYSRKSR